MSAARAFSGSFSGSSRGSLTRNLLVLAAGSALVGSAAAVVLHQPSNTFHSTGE